MKRNWYKFLEEIEDEILRIEKTGSDIVCFRGQTEKSWDLLPSLLVKKVLNNLSDADLLSLEIRLYFDFVTNAGNLLNRSFSDWDILFEMRHHGIPTRVLDWTENFGTALYFALNSKGKTPTIWIFDPFELNKISYKESLIPNPNIDLEFSYNDAYLKKSKTPFYDPIVIIAPRTSDRLFAQKGLFTLQGTNFAPMNKNVTIGHCFKSIEIPLDSINDAKMFLKFAGINDYSMFPDLDGLAKHLNKINQLE